MLVLCRFNFKIEISDLPANSKIFSETFTLAFPLSPKLEGGACPESSVKTKSLNIKPCPVGLSFARRCLPSYQKCHKLLPPLVVGCFP